MGRQPDERREKAWKMFKRSKGEKSLTDIATALNVPSPTVRGWKYKDKWEEKLKTPKPAPKKRGGQPGNKNAVGSKGGGDPLGLNALRHGAYATHMGARMRSDEQDVFGEDSYSQNVLDALRLEVNTINVQQLRLMTRLSELQQKLEDREQLADAEELAQITREIYTIESALDKASGRKIKLLQILYEATDMQRDVEVVFGGSMMPGIPEHQGEEGDGQ